MKKLNFLWVVSIVLLCLTPHYSKAQLISPKARATPSEGPTIDQAQKEDYMGPKARAAVTRFVDKSAKGRSYGHIGDGMAEMLANALFATNRFIILERQSLGDVIAEQDFGASGRVRQETAARIGEIEGADLLIEGTVTEFEPGASGAGAGVGGILPRRLGHLVGGVMGGLKTSHVALIVRVIDARTGRRLASEQIEGKATDIEGGLGLGGSKLSGVFSGYSNTPMEKAIRIAIDEAVRVIVAKTPAHFYRVSETPQAQPSPVASPVGSPPPVAPPPQITSLPPPVSAPPVSVSPPSFPDKGLRFVYVSWPKTSLREGPATHFKTIGEITRGTSLAVLEEQGAWMRVRLEDGQEGWVGKATTSENP